MHDNHRSVQDAAQGLAAMRGLYLDCMGCINCDLIICFVTVRQAKVVVLSLQVKVWKDELCQQIILSRSDWALQYLVLPDVTEGPKGFAVESGTY